MGPRCRISKWLIITCIATDDVPAGSAHLVRERLRATIPLSIRRGAWPVLALLRRLRRYGREIEPALRWSIGHPSHRRDVFGRLLQEVSGRSLPPPVDADGSRLDYLRIAFLNQWGWALDDPSCVAAQEATHMRDDDTVIGIALDGKARAYPWWIIDTNHFVNDGFAGQRIVVMLCELCSTGLVYDASTRRRVLHFDHGPHYRGTNTMRDRATGSVWSPYLGKAVAGPLKDTPLSLFASFQMTWSAWRTLHPETTVLGPGLGDRGGHGADQAMGSPGVPPDFRQTIVHWDERLPHNALVLGVVVRGSARVYPLESVRQDPVINDDLSDELIVIFADPTDGSWAAAAYRRAVRDRPFTFEWREGAAMDAETGSRWNVHGLAFDGPSAGTQLEFVESHVSEWYVWAANYPKLDLYRPRV